MNFFISYNGKSINIILKIVVSLSCKLLNFSIILCDHKFQTFSLTGIEFEILSAFYDGENFQSKSVRAKQVYPNSEWSSGAFQLNLADLVEPLIPNSGDPQDPDSEDYDDEESMYPHPNFLILYVDESFLVVSYCDQIEPLVKNEQMWILSREQFPNIEKVGRVESKLFHTEIDNFQMFEVDQETCSSSEMRQKFPFRALLRVGDDPFESDQAYLKYLTCLNQATTMIQIDLCVNYLNMGFFGHWQHFDNLNLN